MVKGKTTCMKMHGYYLKDDICGGNKTILYSRKMHGRGGRNGANSH